MMSGMKKWEYNILSVGATTNLAEIKNHIDNMGKEGWELVAVIPIGAQVGFAGSTISIQLFFKREVK